eukprot:984177-Amphidinium_carterae.1
MGKAVHGRNNQLRKMYIGRMRANDGYHHDSSPSSGHSVLTSDEDFNEHPDENAVQSRFSTNGWENGYSST